MAEAPEPTMVLPLELHTIVHGSDPGTWVTVVSGHMGDTRA